jgi:hypothetical protein
MLVELPTVPIGVGVRYKVWRSNKDKELHLPFAEGAGAFNALPTTIRHLGPWTGSREGEVDRLRLPLLRPSVPKIFRTYGKGPILRQL